VIINGSLFICRWLINCHWENYRSCFVQAGLDLVNNTNLLNQQSTGKHVATVEYILLRSCEKVFYLTYISKRFAQRRSNTFHFHGVSCRQGYNLLRYSGEKLLDMYCSIAL